MILLVRHLEELETIPLVLVKDNSLNYTVHREKERKLKMRFMLKVMYLQEIIL